MRKLIYVGIFVTGAAVGSAATWFTIKTKYEQIAQEEIDSVKEHFRNKQADAEDISLEKKVEFDYIEEKDDVVEYVEEIVKNDYTNYSKPMKSAGKNIDKDYICYVDPLELGEERDYDAITLTYYSDGVLADDEDELVDHIDRVVGSKFMDHFGEYEEDSVCVRNDKLKCYYEILMDVRTYSDALNAKPYRKGL